MRKAVRWAVLLWIAGMTGGAEMGRAQPARSHARAETEVRQTLSAFLQSFENLDWRRFKEFFAPDATMFHPALPNGKRIDTPQEFETAWLGVFARIKKSSGRETPPYMSLEPQNEKIQMLSPQVALVTFHLSDDGVLNRRTIVFRRDAIAWKIVHIHASNLTVASHQPEELTKPGGK